MAADPDVTGVDDARIGGAQSGQVSIESFTYDPVAGKRVPVVLTAGRMPAHAGRDRARPDDRQRAARGDRLGGPAHRRHGAAGRSRVTGIGFVPAGPHNGYADGAWLTPAGYDRIFRGAHYAFKFHVATVSLRPGADVAAVARRLNASGGGHPGRPGLRLHARRHRSPRSRRSRTWPCCRSR